MPRISINKNVSHIDFGSEGNAPPLKLLSVYMKQFQRTEPLKSVTLFTNNSFSVHCTVLFSKVLLL
jgi:hypothetical protein